MLLYISKPETAYIYIYIFKFIKKKEIYKWLYICVYVCICVNFKSIGGVHGSLQIITHKILIYRQKYFRLQ